MAGGLELMSERSIPGILLRGQLEARIALSFMKQLPGLCSLPVSLEF